MKGFWRLYKKEVRFLAGLGIGFIVLMIITGLFADFVEHFSPKFYHNNIMIRPQNPTFLAKYIVRPIILFPSRASEYIYAMIFLYALLHEHITKSRYQMLMVPVRRVTHLAATFIAVITWALATIPALFIWRFLLVKVSVFIPLFESSMHVSPEVIVFSVGGMAGSVLMMCALVMLGYAVAVSVRRMYYIIGAVTVIAGNLFAEQIMEIVTQFFARNYPWQQGVPALTQLYPWGAIISQFITALIFLVPALIVYDRYAEV